MHVDEHDVGLALADHLDGGVDLRRIPDDVELTAQLHLHAGEEQMVVIDEEDARPGHRFITSSTSVPSPGTETMVAVPPWRLIRPLIDSAIPW